VLHVNWKAAATVATGATALAGWLVSPSQPATHRAAPSSASTRPLDTSSVAEQARRLANRIRPAVAYDQPQRNPFRYQPVAPPPRRLTATAPAAASATVPAAPVAPAPFPFRLSGTARDGTSEAPVWTAILAGGTSGLVLAGVGETVGGVYKIESVTDTTADLVDVRDGRTTRLTLPAAR
jgi:hypothetical protein